MFSSDENWNAFSGDLHANDFARTDSEERCADGFDRGLDRSKAKTGSNDNDDSDLIPDNVLLKLKATIAGEENIK